MSLVTTLIGLLGGWFLASLYRRDHNKISEEKLVLMVPKDVPEELPPYSKGDGDGYREAAAKPQCEVCRRSCVHCGKERRRQRRLSRP